MTFKAPLFVMLSLALLIPLAAHADLSITTNLPNEIVKLNLGETRDLVLGLNSTVDANYTITAQPMFLNSSDPGLNGTLVAHEAAHATFAVHAVEQLSLTHI